jgi:hypothetical protein
VLSGYLNLSITVTSAFFKTQTENHRFSLFQREIRSITHFRISWKTASSGFPKEKSE